MREHEPGRIVPQDAAGLTGLILFPREVGCNRDSVSG